MNTKTSKELQIKYGSLEKTISEDNAQESRFRKYSIGAFIAGLALATVAGLAVRYLGEHYHERVVGRKVFYACCTGAAVAGCASAGLYYALRQKNKKS
jgi:uncharacterized membrane protein (DUF441 family)